MRPSPISFVSEIRAISRRTGSKPERTTVSGVSSMIRSMPVACSRARMLRPSRPMIRPFISSLGRWTTVTVCSAVWSAATRCIAVRMMSLGLSDKADLLLLGLEDQVLLARVRVGDDACGLLGGGLDRLACQLALGDVAKTEPNGKADQRPKGEGGRVHLHPPIRPGCGRTRCLLGVAYYGRRARPKLIRVSPPNRAGTSPRSP